MLEVCAALIKVDGKYLICQRAKDDDCGGQWEFPGGKKESCENLEECIVREVYEELSLEIVVDDVYAETFYVLNGKEIFFTFYDCSIISGEIQLNVHDAIAWAKPEEFSQYNFMEADKEVLEMLLFSNS